MERFAFLAAVGCLVGCALAGTSRAGIIYDVYSGGTSGTLLAEYVVPNLLVAGDSLDPFTPKVLTPTIPAFDALTSPGTLSADHHVFAVNLDDILYDDQSGYILSNVASLPTS